MVLLMRALDPLQHEEETVEILDKLKEADHYRKGYYSDLGTASFFNSNTAAPSNVLFLVCHVTRCEREYQAGDSGLAHTCPTVFWKTGN